MKTIIQWDKYIDFELYQTKRPIKNKLGIQTYNGPTQMVFSNYNTWIFCWDFIMSDMDSQVYETIYWASFFFLRLASMQILS